MPYEKLAQEIILQAVKDYREALPKTMGRRKNSIAKGIVDECEEFFQSLWFSRLTAVDGRMLMEKLQGEVHRK